MSQIAILGEGVDFYDLAVNEADGERLLIDHSLRTAVLISLLTDRRVDPSEAPEPTDLRGFWGDTYPDAPGDSMGSRLWTLAGQPMTARVLSLADAYVREALTWMVEDGITDAQDNIVVEVEFVKPHSLAGRVGLKRPNTVAPEWITAWNYSLSGGN